MQRLKVMGAAALFFVNLSSGGRAAEMTSEQLKTMLADMGYQPAVEGEMVKVDGLGVAKLAMYFILRNDRSVLTVEVPGYDIEANQVAAMPATAMLQKNGENISYFYSLESSGQNGKFHVALQALYDVASVNKVMLRQAIDGLITNLNNGEPLWNPDKWPAAAASTPAAK